MAQIYVGLKMTYRSTNQHARPQFPVLEASSLCQHITYHAAASQVDPSKANLFTYLRDLISQDISISHMPV